MSIIKWVNGRFVPMESRIAFVTFSNGRYLGQEEKLISSVKKWCPEADVFAFHSFEEIDCPPHSLAPYAFKPCCIEKVRAQGYKTIWWCDSIVRLSKSIDDLLPTLSKVGVYLQSDGWKVGTWANDRALQYFNVTRDQAMEITAIYACIMGFDFRNPVANEFLRRWKKAAWDGIFYGRWDNKEKTESQDERCRGHRHDQTCAELISYDLKIPHNPILLLQDENKHFTTHNYP
jgi:hypothetical protein